MEMKKPRSPLRQSGFEPRQLILVASGALLFLACSAAGAIERPVAAPGEYESQTACDHPYFPLRQRASWTFTWELGSYSWTVIAVNGDLASASATLFSDFEGDIIRYHWTCSSAGVSYDQIAIASDAPNFLRSSPSSLPAEGLGAGARWTSQYIIHLERHIDRSPIDVRESHSAGGVQSQTTGLGTLQAIPVSTTGTQTYPCDTGDTLCTDNRHLRICWFVYGVGLLGCDFDLGGSSSRSELVRYHIP